MPRTRRTATGNENPASAHEASDSDSEAERYAGTGASAPVAAGPAGEPQSGPAAAANFDVERLVAAMMETFARTQAETNRTFMETLRSMQFTGSPIPSSSTPMPTAPAPAASAIAGPGGNFSRCSARFDGASRDPEVLEAFVDAVQVYKECTGVSDEHAVRGLPMLLSGDAAVWWRGARAGVISWADAVARLRAMYGAQQPAYKVLRDIFANDMRDNDRAEVFVAKVRASIARLPYAVPSAMEVDIVYGLLHRRIRKRLPRDTLVSIDMLLERARDTEDAIAELQKPANVSTLKPITAGTSAMGIKVASKSVDSSSNSNANHASNESKHSERLAGTERGPTIYRGTRNKSRIEFGSKSSSNNIRCYGCGQPGVVRSKCDTCSTKRVAAKPSDFNTVAFDETSATSPMVSVKIVGKEGVAVIDTGATHSVASAMLYKILIDAGVEFYEAQRSVRLADGSRPIKTVMTATVPIILSGREIPTELVAFPGDDTKTLLGRDFILKSGIVVDVAQDSWYFSDDPTVKISFIRSYILNHELMREKSHFARKNVKSLGHVIVPGGIRMDPDKTSAIIGMQPPRNVRHLKCFLQTTSWFRRFIPEYANVARPLTTLLKKNSKWQWGSEQEGAFEKLKGLLVSAPILRQADVTMPFTLRTDSSGYALGAALLQGEGAEERPIEYASRLLTSAETNYNTTEREALAVVWAVSKFRGYIDGAEVVVKSDHQPLKWLMSMKSPSGRLARWALSLQEYNLKIEYTPGKSNVLADTLSRPACTDDVECDLCLTVVDMPQRSLCDVRGGQLQDPEVRKIIEALESDDPSRGRAWADRGYVLANGVLYRYGPENDDNDGACLVVPDQERANVLAEYHDAPIAGHFGVERTLQRIASKYHWPGMRTYVTQYIKNCVECQRYKVDTRKKYADENRRPAPDYQVGDLVLLKTQGANEADPKVHTKT